MHAAHGLGASPKLRDDEREGSGGKIGGTRPPVELLTSPEPAERGPAIIGAGQRLCFTPCHRSPVRFTDDRVPPIPAEPVVCPRGGEFWTVEFPQVPPGEDTVAVWRR